MKVVFLEEVQGSGFPGDVKDVADGFARNYLLPRNLAIAASKQALQKAEKLAEAENKRQDKLDKEASGVATALNGATLTFKARVGDQGRLFGSITAGDIAEEAAKIAGEEVDRHRIHLPEPIKQIGTRIVRLRLTRNVEVELTVEVKNQDEKAVPEPAPAATADAPAADDATLEDDETAQATAPDEVAGDQSAATTDEAEVTTPAEDEVPNPIEESVDAGDAAVPAATETEEPETEETP